MPGRNDMRMCGVVLAAALLLGACGRGDPPREALQPASWHEGGVPGTPPQIQLVAPLPGGEWHLPGGDYASLRFSPLDQITTANVAELKQVTSLSTGIPRGHEGAPLVVNNTMYVVTPYPNNVMAIDLVPEGGRLKWMHEPLPDPRSVGIACCDVVNRGAVYADGKIIFNTLDAHTIQEGPVAGSEIRHLHGVGVRENFGVPARDGWMNHRQVTRQGTPNHEGHALAQLEPLSVRTALQEGAELLLLRRDLLFEPVDFVYELGALLVCPECAHEWAAASPATWCSTAARRCSACAG